jgi:hypothetical protein
MTRSDAATTDDPAAVYAVIRARISSIRARSSRPNTARKITSSVIACISGCSSKGRPIGQRSIARSASSAITSA